MLTKLHANATTTPRTRAYIQASGASAAELADELGVHEKTVRRWKARTTTADRSHRPKHIQTRFDPLEEEIAVELRTRLALSIDDIAEVMRRCIRPDISRSAVHRCLKRHGVSQKPRRETEKPLAFTAEKPLGFVHIDVKYLTALDRRRAYAYVAIDRATRFVYLEILPDRKATTSVGFLERLLQAFPIAIHTILTDNGSEFTDRYAVDKPGKPEGKPSGKHDFDKLCKAHGIRHILSRPFRPQTNGMVERFNRRLSEALQASPRTGGNQGKNSFASHQQRNDFITTFVHNYNNTRLRCLNYRAPRELAANLPGHNTKAGIAMQAPSRKGLRRIGSRPVKTT